MIKIFDENMLVASEDGGRGTFDSHRMMQRLQAAVKKTGEPEWLVPQLIASLEEAVRRRNGEGRCPSEDEIDLLLSDILVSTEYGNIAEALAEDGKAEGVGEAAAGEYAWERQTRYITPEDWKQLLPDLDWQGAIPKATSDLLPVARICVSLDGCGEMSLAALENFWRKYARILNEMCDVMVLEWGDSMRPERRVDAKGIGKLAESWKENVKQARTKLLKVVEAVDGRINVVFE